MSYQKTESFHIVQIVIKNTSTLDFSLPVLWGLRKKHPDARISILYTSLNKNQILRNSEFMTNFCSENNIGQYDLCDFLITDSRWLPRILRRAFIRSYSDKLGFKELQKAGIGNSISVIKAVIVGYIRPIERIMSRLFVNNKQILNNLNPDIVLFDNRSAYPFSGRDEIYRYFEANRKPVVLLPHAPHYIDPTNEFCRFDEYNENLMPAYTEHWMPFKYGEPWEVAPAHRDQFVKIGYPGLDSRWWKYISSDQQENAKTRCLLMARKSLPEGEQRPPDFDEFTLDYEEALSFYVMVGKAVRDAGIEIEIVVKPHPSSSEPENRKMLSQAGLENYIISYDSFYDLLPSINVVVAQFTTALSLPIAYGIPTVVVETKLQHYVHKRWPLLADYYLNLQYYSRPSEFPTVFRRLLNMTNVQVECLADRRLLRKYFDDNALDLAIKRLEKLMGESYESH